MLKKKELLELIAMRLATLKAYVSTVNSIHLFDVNVVAEDFFAALLNEIYGYSLVNLNHTCLLYTSPSPRDRTRSRMPSSA